MADDRIRGRKLGLARAPHNTRKLALTMGAPSAPAAAALASLGPVQSKALAQKVDDIADKVEPGNPDAAAELSQEAKENPLAFEIAMNLTAQAGWAMWEKDNASLNPIAGIKRRKPFPVKLLPTTTTLDSSGAGTLTWTPQEEFQGFRVCVPSGQPSVPCFLNQFQAGDRMMQAQSGRLPSACLSEKTDVGRLDLPIVRLGETLTATVSGGTASEELAAVIMGYARGKSRLLPEGAVVLGDRWEPFDVTVIAAASSAVIALQPQRHIIPRRLAFDDTVSNFANLYVTAINVQDDPQFVQGQEIPAALFSELAQDDWVDFDMCQLGGTITINVRNSNTSQNVTAQGMAVVDLVSLPGDAR